MIVHLGRAPWVAADPGDGGVGRVLYVAERDLIVVVGGPDGRGGRYVSVVASLVPMPRGWPVVLDGFELAAARDSIPVAAGGPCGPLVLAWLWRVWRQWSGQTMARVVHDIVHYARVPGSARLALTAESTPRVCDGAILSRTALDGIVDRLVLVGLLTVEHMGADGGERWLGLRLPDAGSGWWSNTAWGRP